MGRLFPFLDSKWNYVFQIDTKMAIPANSRSDFTDYPGFAETKLRR